ncbi:hypothetical protein GGR54DRAFT_608277 [Hypoxylon sp. NC1633]|nr:hypothetical protein GGR54DRAFT_608277 [Hypoxylon sp. NC1633]
MAPWLPAQTASAFMALWITAQVPRLLHELDCLQKVLSSYLSVTYLLTGYLLRYLTWILFECFHITFLFSLKAQGVFSQSKRNSALIDPNSSVYLKLLRQLHASYPLI